MQSELLETKKLSSYNKRKKHPSVCLGDVADIESALSEFDRIMPKDHAIRKLPRKWWEWDYIDNCASELNLLNSNVTALGLGVGDEPLIFHFSNYCKKVIATDLYSSETSWKEARYDNFENIYKSSPIPYKRERVEIKNADMRNTGEPVNSIDFIWSTSSIEHVPTLKDLFQVFREIDRVLKIGGHAVLTTEYCITDSTYLLPGVNAWNKELFDIIMKSLPGFEVLGDINLGFNALHPGNAARPRRYMPVSSLPGCSNYLSYYHRAGMMANPVGLSMIVPIAFVIKKTTDKGVLEWERIELPKWLRRFTDGLCHYYEGNNEAAVSVLSKIQSIEKGSQEDHIRFRFEIDARARNGEMKDKQKFVSYITEFLKTTPEGPVQDADCLDICAYLLGECGYVEEALEVYEKCLFSPSTNRDHVFELLLRYLVLAKGRNQYERAQDVVTSILRDLRQFGLSEVEYCNLFSLPAKKFLSKKQINYFDTNSHV